MDNEMRSDTELLVALTNEAPIVRDRQTHRMVSVSRKTVAMWTGLSIQTVSDYAVGKINIPIGFWRAILEHHSDPRIVALLIPPCIDIEIIDPGCGHPINATQFFREAVKETGTYHEKQTYLAEILADGRIDDLDEASVQDYSDAYLRHRQLDTHLHRAILNTFAKAAARKEAAR